MQIWMKERETDKLSWMRKKEIETDKGSEI